MQDNSECVRDRSVIGRGTINASLFPLNQAPRLRHPGRLPGPQPGRSRPSLCDTLRHALKVNPSPKRPIVDLSLIAEALMNAQEAQTLNPRACRLDPGWDERRNDSSGRFRGQGPLGRRSKQTAMKLVSAPQYQSRVASSANNFS